MTVLFMNTWEVDEAVARYRSDPVKGPAARLLAAMRDLANENSDGWAYWPKPCRACAKLQELLKEDDPSKVTPERLKKAIAPVKAFCTRFEKNGFRFPQTS